VDISPTAKADRPLATVRLPSATDAAPTAADPMPPLSANAPLARATHGVARSSSLRWLAVADCFTSAPVHARRVILPGLAARTLCPYCFLMVYLLTRTTLTTSSFLAWPIVSVSASRLVFMNTLVPNDQVERE
jgi:hypothetical protein